MPGQYRCSVDQMYHELQTVCDSGVGAVMLFGVPGHKDEAASQAYAEDGVIQRALKEAKKRFPDLRMSVCVNIPLTGTVECSAARMWIMTEQLRFWRKLLFPMCRPVQIW